MPVHSKTKPQPRIRVHTNTQPPVMHPGVYNLVPGGAAGNQAVHNKRIVKLAFMNALRKRNGRFARGDALLTLEKIADRLITQALLGEIQAAKEIFDRVDGKAAQMLIGDPENPIVFQDVSKMSDSELEQIARGHLIQGEGRRV